MTRTPAEILQSLQEVVKVRDTPAAAYEKIGTITGLFNLQMKVLDEVRKNWNFLTRNLNSIPAVYKQSYENYQVLRRKK